MEVLMNEELRLLDEISQANAYHIIQCKKAINESNALLVQARIDLSAIDPQQLAQDIVFARLIEPRIKDVNER